LSEFPSNEPVSTSYDPESEVHRVRFDPDAIAPSMAIVEAMASILDTPPTKLEPLVKAIDPMALDRLVNGADEGSERTLEFRYLERRLTVHSHGVVEVGAPSNDG
jgi:hypothetical protein